MKQGTIGEKWMRTGCEDEMDSPVRTGKFLVIPDPSAIMDHYLACDTSATQVNLSILTKVNNVLDLRILESLHILKTVSQYVLVVPSKYC